MRGIKEDCYWYDYEQDMGARIPFCKLQKGFNYLQSCEGCNQYHSKYKRTQADRIRAMSDEELAKMLAYYCGHEEYRDVTADAWLDCLKQEASNG